MAGRWEKAAAGRSKEKNLQKKSFQQHKSEVFVICNKTVTFKELCSAAVCHVCSVTIDGDVYAAGKKNGLGNDEGEK